jgi:hypothetical protein
LLLESQDCPSNHQLGDNAMLHISSSSSAPLIDKFGKEAANASDWLLMHEFDPNQLLDALIQKMHLQNDAALSTKLEMIHPIISMVRDGRLTITPAFLFAWIREATGIPAQELHELIHQGRAEG